MVANGLITDEVREKLRQQIIDQENELDNRMKNKREMQVRFCLDDAPTSLRDVILQFVDRLMHRINLHPCVSRKGYLFEAKKTELVIVKRLIQGRNNVIRVRVEPRLCDQGRRKNDTFT